MSNGESEDRHCDQLIDEMNQEESEQDEVDGMKEIAPSGNVTAHLYKKAVLSQR